jgi:hypothetical protein
MPRFYVDYTQECTSTMMQCHGVIEADNWQYARANWEKLLGAQGYSVQSVGGWPPAALFELPLFMADWDKRRVLDHYHDAGFKDQWVAPDAALVKA